MAIFGIWIAKLAQVSISELFEVAAFDWQISREN